MFSLATVCEVLTINGAAPRLLPVIVVPDIIFPVESVSMEFTPATPEITELTVKVVPLIDALITPVTPPLNEVIAMLLSVVCVASKKTAKGATPDERDAMLDKVGVVMPIGPELALALVPPPPHAAKLVNNNAAKKNFPRIFGLMVLFDMIVPCNENRLPLAEM